MEQPHDGAQGHTVNIAAGRGFRSVDVAVRVDPKQSDPLISAAIKLGDAGDSSRSYGVVAAKR